MERRASLQIAPHIGKLDRLGGERNVVHLLHDSPRAKGPPSEAHPLALFQPMKSRDRQVGVCAADGKPEIELATIWHSFPPPARRSYQASDSPVHVVTIFQDRYGATNQFARTAEIQKSSPT